MIASLPALLALRVRISSPLAVIFWTTAAASGLRPSVAGAAGGAAAAGAEAALAAPCLGGGLLFAPSSALALACFSMIRRSALESSLGPRTKGRKSMPPMKGRRGSGTTTPSGVWWFSSTAQIPRPVAQRVEFSMWTKDADVWPIFFEPQRMPMARDWKSVQFEHETSSLYVPCPGNQPSRSYFLTAASLSSPETMVTTRYGTPRLCQNSSAFISICFCISWLSSKSSLQMTNCSTFSNWCTRKMPRMSLPLLPASLRKQVETPA
mmetsp:Transcript_12363/g.35761  ORF Transcript_12363/g.35761 Transcript_12363/m.35761 type:complete len:265 (+) Transcript_12363:584-1378(+)